LRQHPETALDRMQQWAVGECLQNLRKDPRTKAFTEERLLVAAATWAAQGED
jgi:hypothetical protein